MNNKEISIVIIEDDFPIRYTLSSLLTKDKKYSNLKIFTSSNGMEGVGYVLITKPDFIIIDSTLPKYSGLELIDYIKTNKEIIKRKTPVVIIHEEKSKLDIPKDFKVIYKNDYDSVEKIISLIDNFILDYVKQNEIKNDYINIIRNKNSIYKFKILVSKLTVKWANRGDMLLDFSLNTFFVEKLFRNIYWIICQIFTSIFLSILYLLNGKSDERNSDQVNLDKIIFRVRIHPTIITILISLIFLVIQIASFLISGFLLINLRISQIFSHLSY